MLPALLVVAPVTVRFAFARTRQDQGTWVPAYKLSSGRQWWRCLRFASSRGEVHPCAQRLAKHLSWQAEDHVVLTDDRLATLLESADAFEAVFGRFWALARQLLITRVQDALDGGGSLFGFVCSTERWNQLRRTFELNIDAAA